ncbi:hypothetical protein [Metabacillus idriensis]|uniref:hypothetical protein n=1 Tax=Metabacillus idriensis TaxID=324768 RepID=UPI003D2CD764
MANNQKKKKKYRDLEIKRWRKEFIEGYDTFQELMPGITEADFIDAKIVNEFLYSGKMSIFNQN